VTSPRGGAKGSPASQRRAHASRPAGVRGRVGGAAARRGPLRCRSSRPTRYAAPARRRALCSSCDGGRGSLTRASVTVKRRGRDRRAHGRTSSSRAIWAHTSTQRSFHTTSNHSGCVGLSSQRETPAGLSRPRCRARDDSSVSRTKPAWGPRIQRAAGVSKPTFRRLSTAAGMTSETASRRIHLLAPARNFSPYGVRKAKRTSRGSAMGTRDSRLHAMLIRSSWVNRPVR
jgi:hypothetical protein